MDSKQILLTYLRASRDGLLWKAEGLGERELRLPRTATGTNLLGLLKHCAYVEHGYFITCFGRTSPLQFPDLDDAEPNADFYATAGESSAEIVGIYREVGVLVDQAIDEMALDTPGHVAWWGERGDTTLGRVLVHVLTDIARHAGHADILREGIDGAAGLAPTHTGLWAPAEGWAAHCAKLTRLADGA